MSNPETKTCQNCQDSFEIDTSDFAFYDKIKAPAPTWCPECRFQRRSIFKNERCLYKRQCNLCDKNIITDFSPNKQNKVYCNSCWWSDKWDGLEYGQDYDYSRNFFEQLKELQLKVPQMNLVVDYPSLINSEYVNYAGYLKNCYLIFDGDLNENVLYSTTIYNTKDSIDSNLLFESELCYWDINCSRCHKVFFSEDCTDCHNVYFSKNLSGCNDCFGCVNLRNKSYHIFNQPYGKEDYNNKLKEFHLYSFSGIEDFKKEALKFYLKFPNKFMHSRQNTNVSGDYVYNSKNAHFMYQVRGVEDGKFSQRISRNPAKDIYDYSEWGNNAQRIYECITVGENVDNIRFSFTVFKNCANVEYSINVINSSNIFGCIGLRNKQYCILNKQYTKESFDKFRIQIIEHMNKMPHISRKSEILNPKSETNYKSQNSKSQTREIIYRYGEFFPPELSPFAYNETIAQEYFPLTKEQAIEKGYSWKEPEIRNFQFSILNDQLPDHIKDVKDDIIGQIIECVNASSKISKGNLGGQASQCTQAFKIIQPELDFYRKMNLPLPRLCPNCRHYQRLKQRNPLKLWKRKCQCAGIQSDNGIYQNTIKHFHENQPCSNEFQTTYSPERSEIVYCERCYQQEVV